MTSAFLDIDSSGGQLLVKVKGRWVFENVLQLENTVADILPEPGQKVVFACDLIDEIDIAGAWVLFDRNEHFSELGVDSELTGFKDAHIKFLKQIIDAAAIRDYTPPTNKKPPSEFKLLMERIGASTSARIEDFGEITGSIVDGFRRPSLYIIGETIRQIYFTGVQAIPVVMVITFLIGVVTAHQAVGQLEQFGATVLVVDLVSISITRELGVLLAAIMVAGRSGSAFAASLGVMKLNEEVDAMRVMGLNPNQMLIIPRVVGLMIALPVLTVFADVAGVAGGALIAVGTLDIGWLQFMERVTYSTSVTNFYVGLCKAPVFALIIAAIGTLRGMQVKSSAEELGLKTTMAVVQSIFMIIVADAAFATLFTRMGI